MFAVSMVSKTIKVFADGDSKFRNPLATEGRK